MRREIGTRIRERRRKAGMTQRQLASEAGVSLAMVSRIERGEGGRIETIGRLAEALESSYSELVKGIDGARPASTRGTSPAPFSPAVMRVARLMSDLPEPDVAVVEALVRALGRERGARPKKTAKRVRRSVPSGSDVKARASRGGRSGGAKKAARRTTRRAAASSASKRKKRGRGSA